MLLVEHLKKNDWSNWPAFKDCHGWKVVKTTRFQELLDTTDIFSVEKTKIQSSLEKGNIRVVHSNKDISPFFIPSKKYQPGNRLMELSIMLYKMVFPDSEISEAQKHTIYQTFSNLFIGVIPSYLGYTIKKLSKTQPKWEEIQPPQDELRVVEKSYQASQNKSISLPAINFSGEPSFVFAVITTFFETYMPERLSIWLEFFKNYLNHEIKILPSHVKYSEFSSFSTFATQQDFENWLKTNPSLYHKTCWFFSTNPIADKWFKQNNIYGERHHIFAVYLKNNYQLSGNINENFNLIKVPYIIHFFLHCLRFVELGYPEDFKAILIMHKHFSHLTEEPFLIEFESEKIALSLNLRVPQSGLKIKPFKILYLIMKNRELI